MSRRLSVLLPDGRRMRLPQDSVAKTRRLAAETLHLSKEDIPLFGLTVEDEEGNLHWLKEERSLQEQGAPEEIQFRARFFVDSVLSLSSASAVECFFIATYNQLKNGQLIVPSTSLPLLLANLIQILGGDIERAQAKELLDLALPSSSPKDDAVLQEILKLHEEQRGTSKGIAMIKFLQQAERMPHYGCHFFRVSRQNGIGCHLGVCASGIVVSSSDGLEEYRLFSWKQLDNLYFKDDKFTMEVHDGRRQQGGHTTVDDDELSKAYADPTTRVSSVGRRSVRLHSFICSSAALCRSVWHAAITQHQFHLDRSHQRPRLSGDHGEQLGRLISNSSLCSSLPSLSSLHSSSLPSMPAAKVGDGSASTASLPSLKRRSPLEKPGDKEKYTGLFSHRYNMENRLRERMKELLAVCLLEGEITGELPKETKKALLPGQELPKLKKRIGTSFSIPEELIKGDQGNRLVQMETDVELHRKIVAAAERLAKDKSMNKSVRKKRQKDLLAATQKLKGLEVGLSQLRLSASKPDVSSLGSNGSSMSWAMAKSCPTTPHGSVPDLHERTDDEEDAAVPRRAPSEPSRRSLHQRFSEASSSSSSIGLPPSGNSRRSFTTRSITSDELDNPLTSPIYENVGYRSTCYRSSYRQAHYPTIQDEQRRRSVSAHSIARESVPPPPMVVSHPVAVRRIPTSVSCSAGFGVAATNSLDRRDMRTSTVPPQGSPSTQRVTTFPVAQTNLSYDNCLPRFQRPSLSHFPARGALPTFTHSVSSGRLQTATDPHMEALLQYYKSEARKAPPPKTATIV